MDFNARMNAVMNETLNISGALLVKIFGRYGDEVRRFSERAGEVRDIGVRQAVVGRWFMLGLSLVSAIGTALVFWAGGHFVLRGTFTIGTIVAFTAYLRELYGPLMALTNIRVDFATSMVSFERVFEVLDLPQEIQEPAQPVRVERIEGHVRFESVSFSYRTGEEQAIGLEEIRRFSWSGSGALPPLEGERPKLDDEAEREIRWALRDVSFEIAPGQVAALVGPSGAGKTTITYLVPRLYDPTDGRVLLDGHDLRRFSVDVLSDHVGMVTQETYLFHDTVRRNLLYGKPDATQEELEAAARAANINDRIADLADGYDTVVGERGYKLSGGEKQRLAIARTILKDPKILILDEATSSLDTTSERLVQAALEPLMEGRTTIAIAHRLSTILKADVIFVLDHGRIVEQGTHDQLLARGGLYARLYEEQFRDQFVEG
jgi:ATP-binding cassette subfamily B protein